MNILLAGANGFLGRALVARLRERGDIPAVLVRDPDRARRLFPVDVEVDRWDGVSTGDWCARVAWADAVVNLCGEPVSGKRWSVQQKRRIRESRILPTRALTAAIARSGRRPEILVNASAVGYYGFALDEPATEDAGPASDFLGETCSLWEQEALRARESGIRVVLPRTGIVLGTGGGALPRMLLLFRMYAGGPIGTGTQWFPWVHEDDFVRALLFCLDNRDMSGPVNIVAPEMKTMGAFCETLGKVLHRPSWLPVPAFVLRAVFGEMAEILLGGRRIVPGRLVQSGYPFMYPALESALRSILA